MIRNLLTRGVSIVMVASSMQREGVERIEKVCSAAFCLLFTGYLPYLALTRPTGLRYTVPLTEHNHYQDLLGNV